MSLSKASNGASVEVERKLVIGGQFGMNGMNNTPYMVLYLVCGLFLIGGEVDPFGGCGPIYSYSSSSDWYNYIQTWGPKPVWCLGNITDIRCSH